MTDTPGPLGLNELLRQFYADVRSIARKRLRRLPRAISLHTSTVIHEAVLRLAKRKREAWHDRIHFFADVKQEVKHVVADYVRRKKAQKRDVELVHGDTAMDAAVPLGRTTASPSQKLTVAQSLERLRRHHPRAADVVFLRFFCDLSAPQIAQVLSMGERSVERDWKFARAWLEADLKAE